MAHPTSRARILGDYILGSRIGSGSFSVVWLAKHRDTGKQVALKEIAIEGRQRKELECLLMEIEILKKINHPNIIRLLEFFETPGKIHLVLEYCRGGDLSLYIQNHGSVPEETAKHFMQQLVAGLQVLRENNIIHRDLKPQNLLLSKNGNDSVLKIADFGLARSLQPRGLAETLCGSPLYMAPEVMQHQKYDAKADLWSVGAILFQLITGKTPFTGNDRTELLHNVLKSKELWFPSDKELTSNCIDLCQKLLRCNPVERLTFEEFFNHPFLSSRPTNEPRKGSPKDGFPLIDSDFAKSKKENLHEDRLPFILDGHIPDRSSPSPSNNSNSQPIRSTYGFFLDAKVDKRPSYNTQKDRDVISSNKNIKQKVNTNMIVDCYRYLGGNPKEQADVDTSSKLSPTVSDSIELIDQDYVLVSGPSVEMPSCTVISQQKHCKSIDLSTPQTSKSALSAQLPTSSATVNNSCGVGSPDYPYSIPSVISQGSVDMGDALEQPPSHCLTRVRSLQQCAYAISELVNEKIGVGRELEAFSIQLVILAIWKLAVQICHSQIVSAMGNLHDTRIHGSEASTHESINSLDTEDPVTICSRIEKEFLIEFERAEEFSRELSPVAGTTEMPDAMEIIFQSALALGRLGAVDELMGEMESADTFYSKAVQLLNFILIEAPSLVLNPPFSLTNEDRTRLCSYIDTLTHRQNRSRSQRMHAVKG